MMQKPCAYCGDMTDMPFECNYCKDPFCPETGHWTRRTSNLEKLQDEIEKSGGQAFAQKLDVSEDKTVRL